MPVHTIHEIISRFEQGLEAEMKQRKVRLPYACCMSTEGLDGFPNARFVSLKEVRDNCFVITGTFSSRKGAEIRNNPKVALTFWWPETQQQVRIQGTMTELPVALADRYFAERNRESRIVSVVSEQGQELMDLSELTHRFDAMAASAQDEILRPENWGVYALEPVRIEFLVFSESRFHDRTLYEHMSDGQWVMGRLQP